MKSNSILRNVGCRYAVVALIQTLLTLTFVSVSSAVVIDDGDGTGNTTAPDDDPGFANVAIRGSASAIYLGNRWVMTASHVGAGTVTLNGTDYSHLPAETVRLSNPSGLSEKTDIVLFRLADDPGLPALYLPCESVGIGTKLTLIGSGHDREVEKSFWNVEVKPGENDDVWTERDSEAGSDEQGYRTQESQTLRWGQSIATLTNFDTESGFGDVLSFQASFDPLLDVTSLAQGVRGDSGGAVFQKNGGLWELVGMIHAVSLLEGQPGSTRTAIYGNETFIADLFRYAETIRDHANFEPAPGDFDGNGLIDALDIDSLLDVIRQPTFASCHFDIDGRDGLDGDDLSVVIAAAGGVLGDANLDGVVGFADFLTLSNKFGKVGTTWSDGDFDGDDQVTFADFLILSQGYGKSIAIAERASAEPVPEPQLDWLVTPLALLSLNLIRRTRSTR